MRRTISALVIGMVFGGVCFLIAPPHAIGSGAGAVAGSAVISLIALGAWRKVARALLFGVAVGAVWFSIAPAGALSIAAVSFTGYVFSSLARQERLLSAR